MNVLDALRRGGASRALDLALAETLRRLRPDTPDAVLLGAALASRALALGHVALPLAQAPLLLAELEAGAEVLAALPAPHAWQAQLAASPWVAPGGDASPADPACPLVLEHGRLYLRRYHEHERRVAQAVRARLAADVAPAAADDARLAQLFPALRDDAHDAQAAFARGLPGARLRLLTGGPGTGKTRSVARALLYLIERATAAGAPAPRVLLAAPTGKAAARLAEALREALATAPGAAAAAAAWPATTLHRLLGVRSDGSMPPAAEAAPLACEVLVLDEASMVELALMDRLLSVLPADATLLLVGDRDQLPAVGSGDVLAALAAAAARGGALATARTELTRRWRQQPAFALAPLADAVRDGDAETALALLRHGLAGVDWEPVTARASAVLALALPPLQALARADAPVAALREAQRFRLLTAVREGAAGSVAWNARLTQALQPPGTRPGAPFAGQLLMVTRNSPRHGLYNGDTGVVWRDPDGVLRVWFEGGVEGAPRAFLPAALPPHECAFALTVHKAQGSEFARVALLLPPAAGGFARALSREGLYTGLTRAREGLCLLAEPETLRQAIGRPASRWSGLTERLSSPP